MTPTPPSAPPANRVRQLCPRCGYDLSGVIESLQEPRPETGTCSECGLEIDWADLLRGTDRRARWHREHQRSRDRFSFEHGDDRRIARFTRTALRCTLPATTCQWISALEPIQNGRLLGFFSAAVVLWVLGVAVPAVASDLWNIGTVISGISAKGNSVLMTLTELVVLQCGVMAAGIATCVLASFVTMYPRLREANAWTAKGHLLRLIAYMIAGTLVIHVIYSWVQWSVLLLFVFVLKAGLLAIPIVLFTLFAGFVYYMMWCAMWTGATLESYFGVRPEWERTAGSLIVALFLSVCFVGVLASM
jgi:hypothetical protein